MPMKRFALLIMSLGAVLGGCDALEPPGPAPGEGAAASLRLVLQGGPPGSRAGEADPDAAVHNGCILEFNAAGNLLDYIPFSGGEPPVLEVPRNQLVELFIVANPTRDLSQVVSKAAFMEIQSDYAANSPGCLEMTGRYSGTIRSDTTLNVALQRCCAKVTVDAMVFKVASTRYDYVGARLVRGYMEKTPAGCTYVQMAPGELINAYSAGAGIGYEASYNSSSVKYTQGDYKVWEYNTPWTVYCYPNASEDPAARNTLAVYYRLDYRVTGIDASTGETVVMHLYNNACVHICLPAVMPNTIYELERLTIDGLSSNTVYLGTKGGSEIPECVFRMTDMTSGEYLGEVKGEVRYD